MANEQIAGNIILVIDDDEINLQMAKMILEKALPCRVLTCDNGIQGIEIMSKHFRTKLYLRPVALKAWRLCATRKSIWSLRQLKFLS